MKDNTKYNILKACSLPKCKTKPKKTLSSIHDAFSLTELLLQHYKLNRLLFSSLILQLTMHHLLQYTTPSLRLVHYILTREASEVDVKLLMLMLIAKECKVVLLFKINYWIWKDTLLVRKTTSTCIQLCSMLLSYTVFYLYIHPLLFTSYGTFNR